MTNLDELGFRRAQGFALEQFITVYATSGDMRWALIALLARSVVAVCSYGRKRVSEAVRRLAHVPPLTGQCHSC